MRKRLYGLFILVFLGACAINNQNLNECITIIKLKSPSQGKRIVLFNDFVHMSFSSEDIVRGYEKSDTKDFISIDSLKIDSLVLPINNLLITNHYQEMVLPIIQKLLKRGIVEIYDVINKKRVETIIYSHCIDFFGERETYRILDSSNIYSNIISIGE